MSVVHYVFTPVRQARTLQETAHRPWPLPEQAWIQGQTWDDLLFAHWPLPVDVVASAVPPALPVDVFDGSAWLGITPFTVRGLRVRGTLPAPRLSTFPELNVRTYVTLEGKPGIYFFSLDAASRLAVEAARRLYKLPYFHARMSVRKTGTTIDYFSARRHAGSGSFTFRGRYEPVGNVFQAMPGSLEHFLVERYCLYTVDRDRVYRGDIHHTPWPLQEASAELAENTMAPAGVDLPAEEPLLHFSRRQDVVIWPLSPVGGDGSEEAEPASAAA